MKRLGLLVAVALCVTMSFAAKNKKKAQQPLKPMNEFVSELMGKMTVQEKIGQLNLLPSGDIQTGISDNSSVSEAIRNGRLGAILNLKGVDNILKVQQMAARIILTQILRSSLFVLHLIKLRPPSATSSTSSAIRFSIQKPTTLTCSLKWTGVAVLVGWSHTVTI